MLQTWKVSWTPSSINQEEFFLDEDQANQFLGALKIAAKFIRYPWNLDLKIEKIELKDPRVKRELAELLLLKNIQKKLKKKP